MKQVRINRATIIGAAGVVALVSAVLFVLKVTGIIQWDWAWVATSPAWLSVGFVAFIVGVFLALIVLFLLFFLVLWVLGLVGGAVDKIRSRS